MKLFWKICEFAKDCALEGARLSKGGAWLANAYAALGAVVLVPLWAVFFTVLLLYLAPLGLPMILRKRREAAKDDRYQNQPWEVRAYRWLKYKPYSSLRGACAALNWLAFSREIPEIQIPDPETQEEADLQHRCYGGRRSIPMMRSKREMFVHVYCLNRNCWQHGMKHYYSCKEVMERIKARGN